MRTHFPKHHKPEKLPPQQKIKKEDIDSVTVSIKELNIKQTEMKFAHGFLLYQTVFKER